MRFGSTFLPSLWLIVQQLEVKLLSCCGEQNHTRYEVCPHHPAYQQNNDEGTTPRSKARFRRKSTVSRAMTSSAREASFNALSCGVMAWSMGRTLCWSREGKQSKCGQSDSNWQDSGRRVLLPPHLRRLCDPMLPNV